jgi:hypothetical protein
MLEVTKMRNRFIMMMILTLFAVSFVTALPVGPEYLNVTKVTRWATAVSQTALAMAGNVSGIVANTSTITRTWQGYYGNITGRIVLGNEVNQTLYDWALAAPQGEIYAVRSSGVPAWPSVACADATELQAEDTALNVDAVVDEDAVNRTFLYTFTHPTFYVGSVQIDADDCAGLGLYDNTGASSANFKEVLLSDGTADLIYTGILARTMNPGSASTGFDGGAHDFQMIVGEDGHGTDTSSSTYYFYLEIE